MLTNLTAADVQATRKAKFLFTRCSNESLFQSFPKQHYSSNNLKYPFSTCSRADAIREDGDTTLLEELKTVGFGEYLTPFLLVSGQTLRSFDYTKVWASLLKSPTIFAKFFMFSVNVIEDPQNPGSYVPLILMNPTEDQTLFRFDDDEATSAILKYPLFRPSTVDADEEETISKIVTRLQRFRSHLKKVSFEFLHIPPPLAQFNIRTFCPQRSPKSRRQRTNRRYRGPTVTFARLWPNYKTTPTRGCRICNFPTNTTVRKIITAISGWVYTISHPRTFLKWLLSRSHRFAVDRLG